MFGHTARMPDESDAKQILTASPQILTASPLENWRRPLGRPRTTWMKTTQQDLISMNPFGPLRLAITILTHIAVLQNSFDCTLTKDHINKLQRYSLEVNKITDFLRNDFKITLHCKFSVQLRNKIEQQAL